MKIIVEKLDKNRYAINLVEGKTTHVVYYSPNQSDAFMLTHNIAMTLRYSLALCNPTLDRAIYFTDIPDAARYFNYSMRDAAHLLKSYDLTLETIK